MVKSPPPWHNPGMRKALGFFALTAVFGTLGGALFAERQASAARNSSGTYSLPAGNPVVSGTVISSVWANTTLPDLGAEITNSLDRNGRGAMLAPLQLSSGLVGAPGLTWSAETTSGWYRIGANDVGYACSGVKCLEDNNGTLTAFPQTTNAGAFVGTALGTGVGVAGTGGSGNGAGVAGTGGTTSGDGVLGTGGAPNGIGVHGIGTGTGNGVSGFGGATSGVGVFGGGGGGNAAGVSGAGAGGFTGVGGTFANGTAATASTYQDAIIAQNGAIDMHSVVNPNTNVGFLNRLVPASIVKAYGVLTTPGANSTSCTVVDLSGAGSLNLSSCLAVNAAGTGFASRTLQAVLATGLSTTGSQLAGSVVLGNGFQGSITAVNGLTIEGAMAGDGVTVELLGYNAPGAAVMNCYANACSVSFVVYGTQ